MAGQPARRTNRSPLTAVDAVRLVAFLVFFVGHSFVMNMCQLAVCPWLQLASPRLNRKFNQQVERWFSTTLLVATSVWAPTRLVLTGDRDLLAKDARESDGGSSGAATANSDGLRGWFAPALEHGCMVISNHQTYFDWIIIWILSYFVRCHGYMKIILKGELKHVPVFGWGMYFLDFIFLRRKWAEDKATLAGHMQRIVHHDDPAWLLIFPEGTVVCEKRTAISNAYADKMGFRRPLHSLLPRSSGSRVCLNHLRPRVEYLYDLTVGYEGLRSGDIPEDEYGLVSMYGKRVYPREIHIHVKRYAVADIPEDEDGFAAWMHRAFVEKDERLARFYALGRFPHTSDEDPAIPAASPVLRLERPARANSTLGEVLWMWAQLLSISIPAYYIYGAALAGLGSLLRSLW
ncbi:hypothetical protein H4R18_004120 [Coemansia javaensis]|uniref:Phospholipid/glycerol acyltransferase domain-containing protein n=1 Tax=Coemansia javaensis TaxID=2761396 RepID=A0A9W8H5U0_9FUNG|nr:hypothetical protein H4R18_004120 [Coemansia javaensis]